jgi:hypothetical protein
VSFVVLRAASIQGQFDSLVIVKTYARSSTGCVNDSGLSTDVEYSPTTVSVLIQTRPPSTICNATFTDGSLTMILGIGLGVGVTLVIAAMILLYVLTRRASDARALANTKLSQQKFDQTMLQQRNLTLHPILVQPYN